MEYSVSCEIVSSFKKLNIYWLVSQAKWMPDPLAEIFELLKFVAFLIVFKWFGKVVHCALVLVPIGSQ